MNIVYLVSCYPAVSHTFILHEIEALRKNGLNVHTVSLNGSDYTRQNSDEQILSEEKRTYYLKQQGFFKALLSTVKLLFFKPGNWFSAAHSAWKYSRQTKKGFKYFLGYLAEASLFVDWLQGQGATQVHVHFGNAAAAVALIAKKLYPFELSLSLHGPDIFHDETLEGLALKLNDADWVRCISFYSRSQAMRLLPMEQWEKLNIVPMGINPSSFSLKGKASEKTTSILCVGRLVTNKGQALLIQAVESLRKENYKIDLELVGNGPDLNALKQISPYTKFSGALNHRQVVEKLHSADLFVLPSFAEGVPIVLMEAMASGVPCISSQIDGIPELIRNGVDGLLVYPSDLDGLKNAIKKLIDNPELAASLAIAGRQRVAQLYDLDKNVQQLQELFKHGGLTHEQSHSSDGLCSDLCTSTAGPDASAR